MTTPATVVDPDGVERRFGAVEHFDPASRAYGIAEHLGLNIAAGLGDDPDDNLRSYRWPIGEPAPLVQLTTNECVAFAWTHDLIAEPVVTLDVGVDDAHRWFRQMQRIDGLPDRTAGTTLIAGAKTMKAAGHITGYRWAFSEPEAAAGVGWQGPAVLGLPWYEGMMRPTRTGFLEPTGRVVGRHAILAFGIDVAERDPARDFYYVINSYGPRWGKTGRAQIRRQVMARLLRERGECCIPIRPVPAAPVPA